MRNRTIAVIGAGPGGLSAAMILAHRGYSVTVFEKESEVGGRNRALRLGPYTFNTGPTFLMMTFVLKEMFTLAGKKMEEYLNPIPLDPIYELSFEDLSIRHTTDQKRMQQEIDLHFPGRKGRLDQFFKRERIRYQRMYPCLEKPYSSLTDFLSWPFIRALPHLSLTRSLYSVLSHYFEPERLILTFTFQSKYLGMSPWACPGAFGMIPFVEHEYGIDYLQGGLCTISTALAKAAEENGAKIRLSTPVKKIITKHGRATGVQLANETYVPCDGVVINADFGTAMETLFEPGVIKKWTPQNLARKTYSCSTFMLYLGLDKWYDEPHHRVLFARDYHAEINRVENNKPMEDDFSVYLNNASLTDSTLAPHGHSALYILVPVSNQRSGISWSDQECTSMRNRIIERIKTRTSMVDIDQHIREETHISPRQWERDHGLYKGATFNLGHSLDQMLYFRPHNRFEEVRGVYLVGGGTHPGSGLPTILEASRISSDLISRDLAIH